MPPLAAEPNANLSGSVNSLQHISTSTLPTPEPAIVDEAVPTSLPGESLSLSPPYSLEQDADSHTSPLPTATKEETRQNTKPQKPQIIQDYFPTARSLDEPIWSPKRLRRVETLSSPKFGEEVEITIVSSFKDKIFEKSLDLPRTQESAEKTYKFIEGTSKSFWGDQDSDQELSLVEGYCIVTCKGSQDCDAILPQRLRLESANDWSEVETVVDNYEKGDGKHNSIRIEITRRLDLCKKTVGMKDLPPKEKDMQLWMWKVMHNAEVSSALEKKQVYIPKDKLENFTTEDIIRRIVEDAKDVVCDPAPDARDDLARSIYHRAPILFAIFIYARVPLSLLETMLAKGIDDTMLFLPEDLPACLSDISEEDRIHYKDLRKHQWTFKAVFFNIIGNDYQLQANEIVPFISWVWCGKGAFSDVYKVMLHRSHHRFSSVSNLLRYSSSSFKYIVKHGVALTALVMSILILHAMH